MSAWEATDATESPVLCFKLWPDLAAGISSYQCGTAEKFASVYFKNDHI